MNVKTIVQKLTRLGRGIHGGILSQNKPDEEMPLRGDLLSSEQMEQHGRTLAGLHKSGQRRAHGRLLKRLIENENILVGFAIC